MKRILIIHTGGTIAMQEDEQTGSVAPSDNNPLIGLTRQIQSLGEFIIKQPFNMPSPHITPKEMNTLKKLIEMETKRQQIDGIVITHGTDTLEETAYFLDLTVNIDIPIVMTGAMRSSNEIGADGLYNFISSIRVASSDTAKNKGVLVVLNDEIHTAMNVTKTHTSNIATFQSPQFGPIGIVTKGEVIFHYQPTYRENYNVKDVKKRVALIKAFAGMDSDLFNAMKDLKYDGVVIEAFGQGNLPPETLQGIQGLLESNIPIVLVSRCFNGITQDIYSYSGGGKELKELGVIFSNGLNGQKASIKLLITLTQTNNPELLQRFFELVNK